MMPIAILETKHDFDAEQEMMGMAFDGQINAKLNALLPQNIVAIACNDGRWR